MKTRILIAGIAVLLLATGTAHTIEYQGKLPKPVQRLPSHPPVVCVAPNWATEPCEDRQPRYWLAALADFLEGLKWLETSWYGSIALNWTSEWTKWDGRWPNEESEDDEYEGGFPKEVRGLWCLSPSESTKTKIILNPHADGCKPDEGVILISYSQFYGPNGQNDCALDTKTKIASEKEIWEPEQLGRLHGHHMDVVQRLSQLMQRSFHPSSYLA